MYNALVIDTIIANVIFLHSKAAYTQLMNKGFDIIKNDDLRNKVIQLFEIQYNYITVKEKGISETQQNVFFNSKFIYSKNQISLNDSEIGKLTIVKEKKIKLLEVYDDTEKRIYQLLESLRKEAK